MAKTKNIKELDISTEEKIKNAARIVFQKKGFAATRTRDIAEEAGINLALLNYYFRSKKKLFEIIMFETLFNIIQTMTVVMNDENTTFEQKIELVALNYIDKISQSPDIPLFMLNEIGNSSDDFLQKIPIQKILLNSVFFKQYRQAQAEGKVSLPIMQLIMNLMGLIVFPFVAMPILKEIGNMKNAQFNQIMQERKKLIPIWVKGMLNS